MFQFARPRRARLPQRGGPQRHGNVSIRAPAEGATRRPPAGCRPQAVSIRAPAEGARLAVVPLHALDPFQFARPRRARHRIRAGRSGGACVSIRAPAEGATLRFQQRDLLLQVSIRAPAEGATVRANKDISVTYQFQFARPRRARRFHVAAHAQHHLVSIRAPAEGATHPS